MTEHRVLTGADLHEPKGISTASSGQVYIADGAGSGSWLSPGGSAYGEMKVTNNASTIALTAGSLTTNANYIKVDSGIWTSTRTNNMTFGASGYLEVEVAGVYEIAFWGSVSISAVGTNLVAFKYSTDDTNGSLSARKVTRQSNNAGDIGSVSGSGFVTLAIGDKLSLWTVCDANTNLTMIDAGFTAILLEAS